MYALYVHALYICLICMAGDVTRRSPVDLQYIYALFVCLICAFLICMPYMYVLYVHALYVCLICECLIYMPYM
jgi:uncharacterized membrane protein